MPWTWKEHASNQIPKLDFLKDQLGLSLGCNGAMGEMLWMKEMEWDA